MPRLTLSPPATLKDDDIADPLIRQFLNHLAVDRDASIYTRRNYRQALREFYHWYKTEHAGAPVWGALGRDDFRSFLRYLGRQQLSRAAISLRFSALRTFCKYLVRLGLIAESPVKNLALPKRSRRLPQYLTKEQMLALLAAPAALLARQGVKPGPGRPFSAVASARDTAVLETIYSCGLRHKSIWC